MPPLEIQVLVPVSRKPPSAALGAHGDVGDIGTGFGFGQRKRGDRFAPRHLG